MSLVISFRASGHFLNWLESQRMEEESLSQCSQRILRVMAAGGSLDVSTSSADLSTMPADLSTRNSDSVASTNIVDIVDKTVSASLDPVMERMAAIEERLGKLRA
ncbi:MAG: hypothetical protein WBA89_19985 [Microcoleus sp.]|uniref:hypothetical protein n=1 Tax=Microcoleus sp. TaxID=44472 RepID=UPI003C72C02E